MRPPAKASAGFPGPAPSPPGTGSRGEQLHDVFKKRGVNDPLSSPGDNDPCSCRAGEVYITDHSMIGEPP